MFDAHWLQQVRLGLLEKHWVASFNKSLLRCSALCKSPGGLRRVNYYVKHLVQDLDGQPSETLSWLEDYGDPNLISSLDMLSPFFTIFHNLSPFLTIFFTISQDLFQFSRHPVAQCGTQHGLVALLLSSPPSAPKVYHTPWKHNGRIQETLRCFTFQASMHHAWWGTLFFENQDLLIMSFRSPKLSDRTPTRTQPLSLCICVDAGSKAMRLWWW